jgi:hypothetical protein
VLFEDGNKRDSRWLSGIGAILLLAWAFYGAHWFFASPPVLPRAQLSLLCSVVGAVLWASLCLRYAFTGKGGSNRNEGD